MSANDRRPTAGLTVGANDMPGLSLGRPSVGATGARLWPVIGSPSGLQLFWAGIGARLQVGIGADKPGGMLTYISAAGYTEPIYTAADAERLARAFLSATNEEG